MFPHRIATSMLLAMLLAACGGDDDAPVEEPQACFATSIYYCGPGPWDPFGIALALAWYSGQCTQEVSCDAGTTDLDAGVVTEEFIEENWTTSSAEEREPNDSIDESMPFALQLNSGLRFEGTVNSDTDDADFLALVFEPSGYVAYLCATPDDCLQPWLQTDELYLELYDQNGTLIETTWMNQTPNGHAILLSPSADLQYYLAVRAADTGGQDMPYRLIVTD